METVDTYCLLPDDADLVGVLDRLFRFTDDLYHGDDRTHPVGSGQEAAAAFASLMRNGDAVRLKDSRIEGTRGGWLYRLEDGAAVVGLSGDAAIPGEVFRRKLRQAVPGGQCCTIGDQPPPMNRAAFQRASGGRGSRRAG
ncbi:MAG TPA: hypothetical protein VFV84_01030 [Burkholderiales bacterium]|nr:hypothetical protein [Burkholderiales bacterium]